MSQAPFKPAEPSNIDLIPMTKTYNIFGTKFTQTTYVPAPSKTNPTSIDLTPKTTYLDSGSKPSFVEQSKPTPQSPLKTDASSINLTPKTDAAPQIPFRSNPTGIDLTPKTTSLDSASKPNFPAPVSQHNSNNLQNNFVKADWPHCTRDFTGSELFDVAVNLFGCLFTPIDKKLYLGPNKMTTIIGPDIVRRKAVACVDTIKGIKKIINDDCSQQHIKSQGKIDPYFVVMPMNDVIEAVKYSAELGGENSGQ
ncbi:MAG: hypothetical protein H6909_04395 [Rickettsiaceae bacterium]|nr:hypothetical protein [Rickettsiaceae bacterium]